MMFVRTQNSYKSWSNLNRRQRVREPWRRRSESESHEHARRFLGQHRQSDWDEGEAECRVEWARSRSYWFQTQTPIAAILFLYPLLGIYELGLNALETPAAERTGADTMLHDLISQWMMVPAWTGTATLALFLLLWQLLDRRSWWCPATCWLGMFIESLILGIGLIGLSRIVDLGFAHIEGKVLLEGPGVLRYEAGIGRVLGFLGAGLYEELLFRLLLIPAIFGLLRLLQTPTVLATTLSVTASSLLFSVAHHWGNTSGDFLWYVFVFRWVAGLYFAWVFLLRGIGIAVGAHVAYDVLVGSVGWSW